MSLTLAKPYASSFVLSCIECFRVRISKGLDFLFNDSIIIYGWDVIGRFSYMLTRTLFWG